MPGKKGMKKYPAGIREEIKAKIRLGLNSVSLVGNTELVGMQYKIINNKNPPQVFPGR